MLAEISLKSLIVFDLVRFHERLNVRIRVPFFAVHLVSTDVKKLVGKPFRHFANQLIEEFVRLLVRGIHRWIEHAPLALDLIRSFAACQLWITDEPRRRVPRHIKLRHDTHTTVARIRDQVPDFLLGVVKAVRTVFLEFGKPAAFEAETLVIRQMPVKYVHFYGFEAVDVSLDHFNWNKMPAGVNHQSPPGKARLVLNADGRDGKSIRRDGNELKEGLQAMKCSERICRMQFRGGSRDRKSTR